MRCIGTRAERFRYKIAVSCRSYGLPVISIPVGINLFSLATVVTRTPNHRRVTFPEPLISVSWETVLGEVR